MVEQFADQKLDTLTEFETKYAVSSSSLSVFKDIAEKAPGLKSFIYAEGPDYFFTNKNRPETFFRIRRSMWPDINGKHFMQLTSKTKTSSSNNRKRIEPNINIDTSLETAKTLVESSGFKLSHTITKRCHIYEYEDATISFYSVSPESSRVTDFFVEFEVDEKTISKLSETDAMSVIEKYEAMFASIDGVSPRRRLRLSLMERYLP